MVAVLFSHLHLIDCEAVFFSTRFLNLNMLAYFRYSHFFEWFSCHEIDAYILGSLDCMNEILKMWM